MTLDGVPFLVLVVGLMVAAVLSASWWLPRTGRTVRGFVARVLVLLGVSLLALLTTAVAVNDAFIFYANWGDLLGTGAPVLQGDRGGVAPAKALQAPAAGPGIAVTKPASPAPLPKPGERIQTWTITGQHSGLTGRIVAILPADYESASKASAAFPVIEAFHGWPGNPEAWQQAFPVESAIDSLTAQHKMAEPIVIAPQLEFPSGTDTECVDGGKGQPQVETWVSQDVPEFVAKTLRVRTDRASWATIGYSSGGWCAAMATMLHPDVFGSGIILGGYFAPEFGKRYVPFAKGSAEAARYDLLALEQRSPPPCALWVETSKADGLSWGSSAALLAHASAPLSVQSAVLQDAGHRASVWVDVLPQAFSWLGATAPGFAPS